MAYQNFYATRLGGDIGTSDTTIPVETAPSVTSGRLTLEARNATQREIIEFTGVSGTDLTGCTRAAGGTTAKSHLKNSLVEMNATAEDLQDVVDAFAAYTQPITDGWFDAITTLSTATTYNQGNRSLVIDSTADLTSAISPGMRIKADRTVAAPTQCADFESSSSQYGSKSSPTGLSFTTTFTCEAWVNLESYVFGGVIARRNASTSGWSLAINASGQIDLTSYRIASNYKQAVSYQSIPLNKWVHIAVSMDMTAGATSGATWYIDGVSVPGTVTQTGTATTLTQGTTDLVVGAAVSAGTSNYDGKGSDARVWSDIRTATEIQDNMYTYPSDTTGLVAHFKLNGDLTDSSSNGNDLTGSGGLVATTADNPWQTTNYGIVTAVSSTQVTAFFAEGYGLPIGSLTNPQYSTQAVPFGFPRDKGKWVIDVISESTRTTSSTTFAVAEELVAPIGSWNILYKAAIAVGGSNLTQGMFISLSTSGILETDVDTTGFAGMWIDATAPNKRLYQTITMNKDFSFTAQTTVNLIFKTYDSTGNTIGADQPTVIRAVCNYL